MSTLTLPSTTERIYHQCARCNSTGVCDSTACNEAGGDCYAELPQDAARAHGIVSFREGYSVDSCPFPEGHSRRAIWIVGFNQGAKEARTSP